MSLRSRCAVISTTPKAPVEIRSFDSGSPPPDTLLVSVELAGICGTDPHLWKGEFPLPGAVILGHEGIGTVVQMHESVATDHASQPLNIGDRVYWTGIRPCGKCYHCTIIHDECGCPNGNFLHTFEDAEMTQGTWATYTEIATVGPRNAFFKVDKSVPPEAYIALGCALPTMLQAISSLPTGAIGADENVVVQGAGAVGLAAVMMAKLAGAGKLIVLDANETRLQKASEFGADHCFNIRTTSKEERKAKILNALGQKGVGLVIECSGVLGAVPEGLSLLGRNAKYLLIGTWAGEGEVGLDPFMVVNKAITIVGSTYAAPKDYYNAVRLVTAHHRKFPLLECVTHRFSLARTQEGLETVLSGEAVKGVIEPNKA
jgi:threonine dehydrogenase-like Zn-dependent dehydrogenase